MISGHFRSDPSVQRRECEDVEQWKSQSKQESQNPNYRKDTHDAQKPAFRGFPWML